MEQTKVNFRFINKLDELIAVVYKYDSGRYECYSFTEDSTFESEKDFLIKESAPYKGADISNLCKVLKNIYDYDIKVVNRLF